MPGHDLILWTIRLSLLLYVAALIALLTAPHRAESQTVARGLWTAACGTFVAHLVAAFHFYHGWSHAHAVADTARQTEALLGWAFGAGIYFSYLFAVLWVADVAWWWIRPTAYRQRSPILHALVHGYLFFIAINGAIVFEDGVTRWVGIPATLLLLALAIGRWLIFRQPHPHVSKDS